MLLAVACRILHVALLLFVVVVVVVVVADAVWRPWQIFFDKWQQINIINKNTKYEMHSRRAQTYVHTHNNIQYSITNS